MSHDINVMWLEFYEFDHAMAWMKTQDHNPFFSTQYVCISPLPFTFTMPRSTVMISESAKYLSISFFVPSLAWSLHGSPVDSMRDAVFTLNIIEWKFKNAHHITKQTVARR